MKLKNLMSAPVRSIGPSASIRTAAEIMANEQIGFLPVILHGHPIGVLTDRDLAVRALASGLDGESTRACDVMTREPILLSEDDELSDALSAMRRHGVRRVMVCTKDGALAGVVSIGDVALAAPIEDAGELLRRVCEPAHKPRRIAQPAIAVARVAS